MVTTMNGIQKFLIGSALVVLPCTLLAQTNAAGSPSGSQQPNGNSAAGQMTPGVSHPGTATTGNDSSGAVGTDTQTLRDKTFLRTAAQGGLAEIKLGQLASQKGSSDEIKKYAQQMIDDHTALNDSMKPIAESMGVTLPTDVSKKDAAEYSKLNGMSGTDFDKEYAAYMKKDHHKDLREFREEASATSDPTLKAAVTKGETVIAEHTRMADQLAAANGVAAGR